MNLSEWYAWIIDIISLKSNKMSGFHGIVIKILHFERKPVLLVVAYWTISGSLLLVIFKANMISEKIYV